MSLSPDQDDGMLIFRGGDIDESMEKIIQRMWKVYINIRGVSGNAFNEENLTWRVHWNIVYKLAKMNTQPSIYDHDARTLFGIKIEETSINSNMIELVIDV